MVQYDTEFIASRKTGASLGLVQAEREGLSDNLQTFRELAREARELLSKFEEITLIIVSTEAI